MRPDVKSSTVDTERKADGSPSVTRLKLHELHRTMVVVETNHLEKSRESPVATLYHGEISNRGVMDRAASFNWNLLQMKSAW
jgi:hypothetical protein